MAPKHRAVKFPQNALAFYIRLYCKRKGSSRTKYHSNLVEATKSWLSLSESEKQQFHTKYKENKQKFELQCFNQLKNAEPFMKVKDARLKNVDVPAQNIEIHELEPTEQVEPIECNEENTFGVADEVTDIGPEQPQDERNEIIIDTVDTNDQMSRTYLVEPLPPILKTAKDLYNMLNSTDEANNMAWTSLPQIERNQYRRAVLLLKKDYITKFKEYLESLAPRELFDYYIKKKAQ